MLVGRLQNGSEELSEYNLSVASTASKFIVLDLDLYVSVNTHVHADHITGSGEIKRRIQGCQSMISAASTAQADVKLKEGDRIKFGKYELEVRSTPGHTNGKFLCLLKIFGYIICTYQSNL